MGQASLSISMAPLLPECPHVWLEGVSCPFPNESTTTVNQQSRGFCFLLWAKSVIPHWQQSHRFLYSATTCETRVLATQGKTGDVSSSGKRTRDFCCPDSWLWQVVRNSCFSNCYRLLVNFQGLKYLFLTLCPVLSFFCGDELTSYSHNCYPTDRYIILQKAKS